MTKKLVFTMAIHLLWMGVSFGQAPPKAFNYSAVARNASGQPLANTSIGIQMAILQTSPSGEEVYVEDHQVETDEFGLFNLIIGGGNVVSGSMDSIAWGSDDFYLRVGMDASGGNNYEIVGTTQLISVPYALYAAEAGQTAGSPNPGTQLGDMLFWDGNAWVTLAPTGQGFILTLCNGVPVWTPNGVCPPASHFNTMDGNSDGSIVVNISASLLRISSPTAEGNPYKTGGWDDDNVHPAHLQEDAAATVRFTTNGLVRGFSATSTGDATLRVDFYDADGVLSTYTTPVIHQNASFANNENTIRVNITNYEKNLLECKAKVEVQVEVGTIFASEGFSGGRYHVELTLKTDTETDDGNEYTYLQDEIFLDANPTSPSITGTLSLFESGEPLTKFISGVQYMTIGSKLGVELSGISQLNANTQGKNLASESNIELNLNNYSLQELAAWELPEENWNGTWSNQYGLNDATYTGDLIISEEFFRYRYTDGTIKAKVYDPWGESSELESNTAAILIDTYHENSTTLGESFNAESERLIRTDTEYLPFDSTQPLRENIQFQTKPVGSGLEFDDALVVGGVVTSASNFFADTGNSPQYDINISDLTGYLPDVVGGQPNYGSFNRAAVYHRKFYPQFRPTATFIQFTVFFTGYFGQFPNGDLKTAVDVLAANELKIYIRRVNKPNAGVGSFGFNARPLSLHGGNYVANIYNDGQSGIDTPGSQIRLSTSSGNEIRATFGNSSSATIGGFWAEIQLINPEIRIDTMNVFIQFLSGSPSTEFDPAD